MNARFPLLKIEAVVNGVSEIIDITPTYIFNLRQACEDLEFNRFGAWVHVRAKSLKALPYVSDLAFFQRVAKSSCKESADLIRATAAAQGWKVDRITIYSESEAPLL